MKVENIKFRAKSIISHNWVEGNLIYKNGRTYIRSDKINLTNVDTSTVCQFTGIKDLKGNEVWEGNILKDINTGEELVVKWSDYLCGFYAKNKNICMYSGGNFYKSMSWLIVIGNIFDVQYVCN